MTFVQLCQRLRQEAGIPGSGPSAVTGQVGELARVVGWVLTAYEIIQNLHENWLFLQTDFSFSTVDGTQNYTKADLGLTDLATWKTSDVKLYSSVADEQDLVFLPWDQFRYLYLRGSSRTQEARPTVFTIKPDLSISFWPIPDAVYNVNGEYFKEAQTMDSDNDETLIPSSAHQMAIVWRGLMLYGAFTGDDTAYAHGQNEYKSVVRKLEFNQLARMTWGEPLA